MSTERLAHQERLRVAEDELGKLQPLAANLMLMRARSLDALGRDAEARQAYLDLLRLDGRNVDALTGLAVMLLRTGHRGAARSALARAVELRPDSAAANANYGTVLSDIDPRAARERFEKALDLDPNSSIAHRGLGLLLLRVGEFDRACRHGRIGFRGHFESWPFRGQGDAVSILCVQSAIGGNTPIELLLDDHIFLRRALVPEFFDPGDVLPEHDLVFNAVGDVERCSAALPQIEEALAKTKAPVINPPSAVRPTGRRENAERLAAIPDIVAPRVEEWPRASLAAADAPRSLADRGFTWPLLLRSPGFHTGDHFDKVDAPEGLAKALAGLPGETLLVIEYIDTRGADGFFRKYRAMIIDGELHPLHLAVSPNWKVHYFSADMADRADHRHEDEAFLRDMAATVGPRGIQALERVRTMLGLDYGGIDFALDAQGRVIVFEANATMVIVPPTTDSRWAYRVGHVERARQAVVNMLLRRAGRPAPADSGSRASRVP
jgi:tetratricopeptide (TPR) repeat protein